MQWRVDVGYIAEWLRGLEPGDRRHVIAALTMLEEYGPRLGRPRVGVVRRSTVHHLKELRPGAAKAAKHRILFAFDPERTAVALVAGDKADSWLRWYQDNIPIAERRYQEHLERLDRRDEGLGVRA